MSIDELWFQILHSEKEGLILVTIETAWPKSPEPNPLMEALSKDYLDNTLKDSKDI